MYKPRLILAASLLVALGCNPVAGQSDANGRPAAAADRGASVARAKVGEWPHWRGPHYDGISRESDWRAAWETAPEPAWKTNVGVGFSSVSVRDGKLYTMGHSGGKKEGRVHRGGDDTIFCLDAATGETVWKHTYPCDRVNNLHEGGPAATPTLSGERVFTLSKLGDLICLNADTGKVLWEKNIAADLDVEMPEWGFSSSPLIQGDLVIVDGGRLAAYQVDSGERAWKTEAYRPGYGSAAPFEHKGEKLVAVLNNDVLLVVRTRDGSKIAETKWTTDYATSATTPIIDGDTIFISTGYNRGCALYRLEDNKLTEIYTNRNMRNHMNNCVLWQGHLYGFDGNSHNSRTVQLKCIDYATGEEQWKHRGLGCGSLMMAGGRLIVLSDDGKLVLAPASPEEFKPTAEAQILTGKCWTVPVLAGGRVYARNAAGDLVCVDLQK